MPKGVGVRVSPWAPEVVYWKQIAAKKAVKKVE